MTNKFSTNYKEHQRQAKKNKNRLTSLFIFAIIGTLFCYSLIVFVTHYYFNQGFSQKGINAIVNPAGDMIVSNYSEAFPFWQINSLTISLLAVNIIALSVILIAYWLKNNQLQNLGAIGVARNMGAELIETDNKKFDSRRLLNIIEEMSIASGIDMPEILITPDETINAFVTGYKDSGFAITVSQGAIDFLSRDELQSVIAHEFGHILNNDVESNMRLSAILAGFFAIFQFQQNLFFNVRGGSRVRARTSSSNRGNGAAIFIFAGIAMLIVSYIMVFFGKIIQAAISRQKELLADSFSVQFTRTSAPLVNALKKAKALHKFGSVFPTKIDDNSAHFLLINYKKSMRTHPTLKQRVEKYGGTLNPNELESIHYKMKREFAQNNKEKNTVSKPDNNLFDSLFSENSLIPLLLIKEILFNNKPTIKQTDNLDEVKLNIYAMFANLDKLNYSQIKDIVNNKNLTEDSFNKLISNINSVENPSWISNLNYFAEKLSLEPKEEKLNILRKVNKIIKIDKVVSANEISFLLVLHNAISKSNTSNLTISDIDNHCILLIQVFVFLGNLENKVEIKSSLSFDIAIKSLFGHQVAIYEPPRLNWATELYFSFMEIKKLNQISKKGLLKTVNNIFENTETLNVYQANLLYATTKILTKKEEGNNDKQT